MARSPMIYQTVILGAGPAGMGPLICAAQRGCLDELLDAGIALVDKRAKMGAGSLGRFIVNADSQSSSFLECLDTPAGARIFAAAAQKSITRRLQEQRSSHAPLTLVARYLDSLGDVLTHCLSGHLRSRFIGNAVARSVHVDRNGLLRVRIRSREHSSEAELRARTVIIALGGYQPLREFLQAELAPGIRLAGKNQDKLMLTDDLLTAAGLRRARTRLRTQKADAPIVILGGSHSAFSAAWALLHGGTRQDRTSGIKQTIHLVHRSPVRVFYPSAAAAKQDGYHGFLARDLCPLTGRVHRFGGLRGDGRKLYQKLMGLGGEPAEPRVKLLPLASLGKNGAELRQLLDRAALIVPAFGYRPRLIPIFGRDGNTLRLGAAARGGKAPPLVDSRCRVVDRAGGVVPALFGIGLGSGFLPWGSMGGEPSFSGQTNGVWLYQNDIGALILKQVAPIAVKE